MKKLSIQNLNIKALIDNQNVQIINNFTFDFDASTCIIGESGSGKSMFALSLINFLPENCYFDGQIFIDNQCVNNHLKELRGKEVYYVPQGSNDYLNPNLKIEKQIKLEAKRLKKSLNNEDIKNLLNSFNLNEDVKNLYPFELSGGMAKKVLLALSLLSDSQIYIFDEPTNGLDESAKNEFIELVKKYFNEKLIIFITHDLSLCHYFKKIIVLKDGKIIEKVNKIEEFKNYYSLMLVKSYKDSLEVKNYA